MTITKARKYVFGTLKSLENSGYKFKRGVRAALSRAITKDVINRKAVMATTVHVLIGYRSA